MPSRGVDGIIVVGASHINKQSLSAIDGCNVPMVCIDGYQGFAKASTVDTENTASAAMGTAHLISQGHRRITYIGQP